MVHEQTIQRFSKNLPYTSSNYSSLNFLKKITKVFSTSQNNLAKYAKKGMANVARKNNK
jgi:hypothetical protein